MTRRKRPLPPQPCSLTDETGNHDVTMMNATRSKGRVTYLCPECGFNVTVPDEGETPETMTEKPSADPEPEPPKEAPETKAAPEKSSKKPKRETPNKDPEKKPRKGGRGVTKAFRDGATIEMEGHTHTLREITICWPDKPATFYEIYREDGEHMGRVSQAVSWQRTENLIFRAYHPETERYPAEGITWTGKLRALRDPKKKRKEPPSADPEGEDGKKKDPAPTLYVTIPKASVERFNIMTDDEISAQVGDYRPDSEKEFYHVSEMSGSKIVVLSKLKRMEDKGEAAPRIPGIGEYITIRIKAETIRETGKRRNLCHWAEQELEEAREKGVPILHPSLTDDLRPKPPEPDRKMIRNDPEPEEEASPVTVFNDF